MTPDVVIKSSDFRKTLGIAPATMSELLKKEEIELLGKNASGKGKYLKSSDARTLLEAKGYEFPKEGKVVSVMICKGGTGKSTSVYFLSHRLASYGAKVLVIDADPQGNLTIAYNLEELGISLSDETPVLLDVILGEELINDIKIPINANLDLIPSTPMNSILDNTIRDKYKNPSLALKKALAPIKSKYDYILIDCAPALNLTNTAIVCASDSVIMPVNPDAFSEMSLDQTISEIENIEKDFSFTVEKKIVFSKFDQREFTSIKYLSSIVEEKKKFLFDTIIRTSSDLKNAITRKEDLFSYPKSTAKDDYDALTAEIMELDFSKPKRGRKKAK